MDAELEVIEGVEFVDETVHLDGKEFSRCRFLRCELVYSGGLPFIFTNSPLDGCQIVFEGAAQDTLNALSVMHRFGMHDFVELMFQRVRNPFQDSIQ